MGFRSGRSRNLDVKEGDWNALGEEVVRAEMGLPGMRGGSQSLLTCRGGRGQKE